MVWGLGVLEFKGLESVEGFGVLRPESKILSRGLQDFNIFWCRGTPSECKVIVKSIESQRFWGM